MTLDTAATSYDMAAAAQKGRKNDDDLKTSWPELVGAPGQYAQAMIHKDRPDVQIMFRPVGTPVPPGYDDKRVLVFVYNDYNSKVAVTPVVG